MKQEHFKNNGQVIQTMTYLGGITLTNWGGIGLFTPNLSNENGERLDNYLFYNDYDYMVAFNFGEGWHDFSPVTVEYIDFIAYENDDIITSGNDPTITVNGMRFFIEDFV